MKKIVFYPILFSVNPALLMFSINIYGVPLISIFPVVAFTSAIALGMVWLLFKWCKDFNRAGFIVFLATLWFFYYIPIRVWISSFHIGSISLSSHWIIFPIWSLIFLLLASNWMWRKISSPQMITLYLNWVCLILIAFSLIRISLEIIPRFLVKLEITQEIHSSISRNEIGNLPDIYYIILDGYARQDVINELYHYDNSSFIQALQARGFYVASKSQANYIQTPLSLASSLNLKYIDGKPGAEPNQGHITGTIMYSQTRIFLESLGYKFIAFSSGFVPTDITNADYYFSSPKLSNSHDLEALLFLNSALAPLIEQGWLRAPITRNSTVQERTNYALYTLENVVPFINGHKMVFAHIVTPHPPFIFDQYGSISPDQYYIMQDAFTYTGTPDDYAKGYVSELKYINNRVIQTIDGILANTARTPIIILQGDHGPDAYLDWRSIENTCLKERFSILNAYLLPNGGSSKLIEDISPVNSFAVIFNNYFGTHIDLLPNYHYFATWENVYPFLDVSDISQTCNLP